MTAFSRPLFGNFLPGIFHLYSRRVKCDLVMCYQMLTGSVNIDTNDLFTRSYLSTKLTTRGNSMKLFKPQITSVRDGNFFTNHVISHWNSLSNSFLSCHHLLLASSVNSGLLIFTCNFSVMSTCNTGHLSEQDCSCLGVL